MGSALDYAARGWRVFPSPPGHKKGYKKAEDHDGRRWGCTADAAEITADWLRWPHANLGVACGSDSGLFVVEADSMAGHGVDGIGNLKKLIAEHGELPETIEQLSPTDSRHLFFINPPGVKIPTRTAPFAPGIDVRGEGGMVIVAPSVKPGHPVPYRWVKPSGVFELATCPDWLLQLCVAKVEPGRKACAAKPGIISSDSDDQVLGWLYSRPNDLPRDDWVRLCFALKGHFGKRARDGWLSFSSRYTGKISAGEAERQWETANPDGRVDLGTAIHLLGGFERSGPGGRRTPPMDEDSASPHPEAADKPTKGDGCRSFVRPTIRVRAGELHVMANEAEEALIASHSPLYVRGELVRPVVDEMPAAHGRSTKSARLTPVDPDVLIDHLSRVSDWTKWNQRKLTWVPTDPPVNVARTVLAREGEWCFRRLSGVVTTPTLRPNGTILSRPGYDTSTQLLLLSPPKLPAIPDVPTREDGRAALDFLDDLLSEFPFVDDASRAVALSGLISPVVRGAMTTVPIHTISAPVAGSGKSYIVDLASAIATGERAPVIAAAAKEEETEKRLGAALLSGMPIVSIDNVNGVLGGDQLCQMIERPVVSVRPLGVSKLFKVENRATCFATGNNITLVGDMTRRGLLCLLDPNVERPELRTFTANPLDRVLSDRGRYVAAALTVVRTYVVAGFPDVLPALASFEDWSQFVRSALVWLGRPDPCETMEKARGEDPVIAQLSALLAAWHAAVGSSPKTTGQIKQTAEDVSPFQSRCHPDLHQALLDVADDCRGEISPKVLGHYLGRHKGRIVSGLKLVASEDKHAKQVSWRVVRP